MVRSLLQKTTRMAERHWSHCGDLLDVLALIVLISLCFCYPHSLNLDFPYIGLFLLNIFMLCLTAFPQTVLSDAQDAQRNLSCNSKSCVSPPCLNNATKLKKQVD